MSPATSTRGQTLWQASRALVRMLHPYRLVGININAPYSRNIPKPSLDILLFTPQLSRTLGIRGMQYITAVRNLLCDDLYSTGGDSCVCEVGARLEGSTAPGWDGMGWIGRESEEIALYNAGARENDILSRAYLRLIKHINSIYKIRIAYERTEDDSTKYMRSAAGYGPVAVPLLFARTKRSLGVQGGAATREKRNLTMLLQVERKLTSRLGVYSSR
ncbi:hypothetical protein PLEOSDRAFT_160331 [Pleurotus ostreatus PC15]|uniref:ABC transmembrane type-1 domain-containing protein n=1 Tax=Pleurotus ostreatus (strain PC15) TaxID=1137138 RepID=A0A067NCY0_PLEO1|nr:hypothetical protein PLEOSDRAFT_160331 [Pleurotus ostreatus PC15]